MINIKNVTISQDGSFKRLSIMYDELDDAGKMTGTNNRLTRVVTDNTVLEAIDTINSFIESAIEEDSK